jgi:hypothetical protein
MSIVQTVAGDLVVQGTVFCASLQQTGTNGTLADAAIAANAGIQHTKVIQKFKKTYTQVPGTAVVAATADIHIVDGATGLSLFLKAAITGAIATGGDRTVNVDIQRSTGGGAFATVLTATIQFTNADTLRTVKSTTFSATGLVVGDILRIIITVAGAAGAQAQGIVVEYGVQETPT